MKPILFNSDMVRAILAGQKTQTRRVIKDPYYIEDPEVSRVSGLAIHKGTNITHGMPYPDSLFSPGDILYVRETWTKLYYVDTDGYAHYYQTEYYYAADGVPDITLFDPDGFEEDDQRIRWHPSIHMPKEAARIFLRVKNVRVEQLQEISGEDCIAEGCDADMLSDVGSEFIRGVFSGIWDSTIKKADLRRYGWDANPWVWVIEFERCEREEVKE